ncbi:MAG: Prenyltransferase and squalene oxidase repeat protein [candidate division WS2 bacterium ADurb.Bin280]|uniref:Prenyltransferase and squalene oxidase repeat protein n=1 Tax=candidate division WS2 bacterium ADurb.Bin280 TaxID=1852829 RepID=A0A1V5SDI9_9BACT|nr:MAG: Prenyltransferase and squalene oxidase repeat protein [candidate division WS2 bacterium ADurb.Bin280]
MSFFSINLKTFFVAFFVFFTACFCFPLDAEATPSIEKSLNYIYSFQNLSTGGIVESGEEAPGSLRTDWAMLAFGASHYDAKTVGSHKSLADFASSDACSLTNLTDIERRVLALESSSIDSSKLKNCNLPEKIISQIKSDGQIGSDLVSTVFGVLSLKSAGRAIEQKTVDFIVSRQEKNGGWNSGYGAESNFTAQTIMALVSSGKKIDVNVLLQAKNYLKSLQTSTGGIKYDGGQWSTESDAFSDSFVIQAIYSMGENPEDLFWRKNSRSIFDDLGDLANADGSYNFNRSYGRINPVWTTSIVLLAQNEAFLPVMEGALFSWKSTAPLATPTPIVSPSPAATSSLSPTAESTNCVVGPEANTLTDMANQRESDKPTEQEIGNLSRADALDKKKSLDEEEAGTNQSKVGSGGQVLSSVSSKSDDLWYWIFSIAVIGLIAGILAKYLIKKYENN